MNIGDYVEIWNGARIECISTWRGKEYVPNLSIGKGTIINQDCHITCANNIEIGENVGISHRVTITDISHNTAESDEPVIDQGIETEPVRIGDCTTIGTGAVIFKGVAIGKHAVIGAQSVVTKDVPDYAVAYGIPAKVMHIRKSL